MRCSTCHGKANYDAARIPGHARWRLAPVEMAWLGQPLGAICEQIKDPQLNGGKTLEQIVNHMARDSLVGWAWHPGRRPRAGARHPGGVRGAHQGLGRDWSVLSEELKRAAQARRLALHRQLIRACRHRSDAPCRHSMTSPPSTWKDCPVM